MDELEYSVEIFEEIREREQLWEEECERRREEQRQKIKREIEEKISQEEHSFRSAMEVFYHEIRKNNRNIEEWESLVAEQPNRATEYGYLIQDAKNRIARFEERISEIERQETRYRGGEVYEEEY